MQDDSRKHRRYKIFATARIETDDSKAEQITTLTHNISQNGIGLQTYKPLEIGKHAIVELNFATREGTREKENVEGTVAWISKEGDFYLLGIAFDEEINPDKQPKLYEHFVRLMKN